MSEVAYRSLTPEEVPVAAGVFLESVNDLARRNGLPAPNAYTPATVEPSYRHLHETGIFEVAELDSRIVAICSAIVRGELWFLSMFWVLPGLQTRGLGRPLLERVRARGEALGARVFATWSSIDFTAVALYMRQGLLPRGPIFKLAGRPERLPARAPGISLAELDGEQTATLEARLRKLSRREDHAFFRARGMTSFAVRSQDRTLGFFCLDGGAIGPAAWEDDPAAGEVVLGCALHEAAARAETVQLVALAVNPDAIRVGLAAGLRVASASHLMYSAPFGALERYVPSGPALF